MEISRFFYKLFLIDGAERPTNFLGSAFPVTPNGGLLTCRHVVNVSVPQGHAIAVFDSERSKLTPIFSAQVYPTNPKIDLAFLPNALGRNKLEFFPLLSPPVLKIGEDIYSFGFFAIGGGVNSVEQGYFAGKIVNFFNHERSIEAASLTLPFAVLEGMSGSPVLTYHNGPKVVGIAIGNRSSRILASEIIEYKDERTEFRESVNRIVEFGVAYHCGAIVQFLNQAGASGYLVSDGRVSVPNLE